MSADTSDLKKVDSAIGGVDDAAVKEGAKETKRRTTSSAPGVMNINDLGKLNNVRLWALHSQAVQRRKEQRSVSLPRRKRLDGTYTLYPGSSSLTRY